MFYLVLLVPSFIDQVKTIPKEMCIGSVFPAELTTIHTNQAVEDVFLTSDYAQKKKKLVRIR